MSNAPQKEYLEKISAGLPLFCDGNSPMPIPSNFKKVSRDELLQNEVLWNSFVVCFRDVFGRSDIWGEGFICPKCGKVFPIEETDTKCGCGEKQSYFHSEEELRQRMTHELESPSFCTLLLSNPESVEVAGFSLGFIGDTDRLARYIATDKHVCGSEEALKRALGNCGKILFFDETGIKRDSRFSASSVISLTRAAFEKGAQEGAISSVTWTARKSPIYRICRSIGFEDVLETETGIVFLFLEDFIPALKLMQNKSPLECAKILVRMSRLS